MFVFYCYLPADTVLSAHIPVGHPDFEVAKTHLFKKMLISAVERNSIHVVAWFNEPFTRPDLLEILQMINTFTSSKQKRFKSIFSEID